MLEYLKAPFLILHFSYYTWMTFLMMLYCYLDAADDTTLYSKCDQTFDLWQQLELVSELESDTADWGKKWLVDSVNGKINWFYLTSLITLVLLTWKRMCLFMRKNHLLRCWGWPSLLNWIVAIAKTASKKIGDLIHSMKFLSPEVSLYFCKSTTILSYAHVWNTVVMSWLVSLVATWNC